MKSQKKTIIKRHIKDKNKKMKTVKKMRTTTRRSQQGYVTREPERILNLAEKMAKGQYEPGSQATPTPQLTANPQTTCDTHQVLEQ